VSLSLNQIDAFKEVFCRYDFAFDYETSDSSLIELIEAANSIEYDADEYDGESLRKEKQRMHLHDYRPINDSIGLYFVYHDVPLLFGGYRGVVGKVYNQNLDFKIIPKTSTIFDAFTKRGVVTEGERIFTDNLE
jgi:hypothetical protein